MIKISQDQCLHTAPLSLSQLATSFSNQNQAIRLTASVVICSELKWVSSAYLIEHKNVLKLIKDFFSFTKYQLNLLNMILLTKSSLINFLEKMDLP